MQEMTLAEEANPLFIFVVLGVAAHRAMGWLRWAFGAGCVFGGQG